MQDKDIAIRTMVTPSSPEALQVTSSCPEYGATTTPDDCATVADATAILHMGHQDHKIATEGTSDCKLEGHGERADADTDDYVKQQVGYWHCFLAPPWFRHVQLCHQVKC